MEALERVDSYPRKEVNRTRLRLLEQASKMKQVIFLHLLSGMIVISVRFSGMIVIRSSFVE